MARWCFASPSAWGVLARQIVAIAQDLEPGLLADSVIASLSLAGHHHRREEPGVPFGPDRRFRHKRVPPPGGGGTVVGCFRTTGRAGHPNGHLRPWTLDLS
jgi:hypothetical protein